MIKKYSEIIVLAFLTISILSSCKSMRQSNYIEKRFLLAKANDSIIIKDKMPYDVILVKTYQKIHSLHGTINDTSKKGGVQILINDTINNNRFELDDRKAVFAFLKNDKYGIQYANEFKQKKSYQKIHRYSSLGVMAAGIFLLSKMGDDANYTKQETRLGNTGGYLLTAGFLNWIGGGFGRAINRRPVPMKAIYAYYFGPLPKKIPRVSKAEKKQILKMFKAF